MWYQPKVDKLILFTYFWYCLCLFAWFMVPSCLRTSSQVVGLWWQKLGRAIYLFHTKTSYTESHFNCPLLHFSANSFFSLVDNVIMFLTFSYIVFWENKHAYLRKYVADRSSHDRRRQSVLWSQLDLSISENNSIGLLISQWGKKYQITKS